MTGLVVLWAYSFPGVDFLAMANGNFENPQWFGLGDHWYAWTASW